jgi:predicted extracellular nuclease
LLHAVPTQAAVTELFFSEYIEGSSNNKALEIYNGTGATINLATGGYNIQMFFNGSATAGLTINLTGTVAAGDVYVVAQSSASATILAQADQTNGAGWFNGDDAVVLRKGTTVIDVIGQIGFDPGTEWGSGLQSTADNTIRRKSSVCAGDTNGGDIFNPSLDWDGFANDTFSGLGSHTASCGNQPVVATCGVPLSLFQGSAGSRVVTASDADGRVVDIVVSSVTPSPAPGTISRTSLAPAAVVGGTASATIAVSASVPAGSYSALITATNEDGPAQTGSCTLTVNILSPMEIWQIQGSGPASPFVGQTVRTENNVVTAKTSNGFFMQTPDARADASDQTSNGIFVFTGAAPSVSVGDQVDVTATVSEFFQLTELRLRECQRRFAGALAADARIDGSDRHRHVRAVARPAMAAERARALRRHAGASGRGRATGPSDNFGDVPIVADSTRTFREPGIAYPGLPGLPGLGRTTPRSSSSTPTAPACRT